MKTKNFYFSASEASFLYPVFFALFALSSPPVFPQPYSFIPPILNPYGIVEHSGPQQESSVLLADIDQDGAAEAFVEIHGDGLEVQEFLYYENLRDNEVPLFSPRESYPFNIANEPGIWPRQFVDIDGDGRQDLFFWEWAEGARVRMQRNVGTPQHPKFDGAGIVENPYGIVLPKTPLMTDHILDAVTPTFVDIDSDGDYDLFYGGAFFNSQPDEGYYFAFNNDPSGNGTQPQFGLPERNPFGLSLPAPGYHRVSFTDQDCDGDYDLYTYIDGIGLFYHENRGTPAAPEFSEESTHIWPLESYDSRFRPTFGSFLDIHRDSDPDLICGSGTGVYFFQNIANQQDAACLFSSTEPRNAKPLFTIYPNPAGNILFLNGPTQAPVDVAVFNLAGQELLRQECPGGKGQISLEGVPPGIYLISLQQEGWQMGLKLARE